MCNFTNRTLLNPASLTITFGNRLHNPEQLPGYKKWTDYLSNLHFFFLLLWSQTLMLVSSTTRPLLGCVWNFPSNYSGLAYATTSMMVHEIFPIILMAVTNMMSLYILNTYGRSRSSVQDAPVLKRVPAEKRAAKVRQTLESKYCSKTTRTVFVPILLILEQTSIVFVPKVYFWSSMDEFLLFLGDSCACHAFHRLLGNQHHLCQLFQLQPRLLSWVSAGRSSLRKQHLHHHVACCSGNRPPPASFVHEVFCLWLKFSGWRATLGPLGHKTIPVNPPSTCCSKCLLEWIQCLAKLSMLLELSHMSTCLKMKIWNVGQMCFAPSLLHWPTGANEQQTLEWCKLQNTQTQNKTQMQQKNAAIFQKTTMNKTNSNGNYNNHKK